MTEEKKINFDYKNADTLKGFISENGKILSSRYTRLNAKEQRKLTKADSSGSHGPQILRLCSWTQN